MSDSNPDHRTPPDVAQRVLQMLSTSEATGVSFRTDMGQNIDVLKPLDRDRKVSVAITTDTGSRRTERWDLGKIASFMESGFWFAKLGGVVHDGGYAEAKQAEERKASRDLGDFMSQMIFKNMFAGMLKAAGRTEEAKALNDLRIDDFDLHAAKAFIAEAVALSGPGLVARLSAPAEETLDEAPAAPRM